MRRLIKIVTSVAMLVQAIGITPFVSAETFVDYSDKLRTLKGLIEQCESNNIPTEYEKINYAVIERFEDYINEEYANDGTGDKEIADFNKYYCDKLYTETNNNLNAYLNGTKKAIDANMLDATNIETNGAQIYSEGKPFYGVGYGHFDLPVRDIENLNNFGANNIQIEVGTTVVTRNRCGWRVAKLNGVDADVDISGKEKYAGNYSMHIKNNTAATANKYYRMYRFMNCVPGDVYQFTVYGKGNLNGVYVELDAWNDACRLKLEDTGDTWRQYSMIYTVPEGITQITPQIISNRISDGYLDNMEIRKKSADGTKSSNLILDGDFESGDELYANLEPLITALDKGEANNVGVNVLLAPHYFPTDMNPELYKEEETGWFLSFNVNHPEARAEISRYLRTLLPYLQNKSCLNSVILSNEPQFDTRDFSDFYTEKFRNYLMTKHLSLDVINKTLGTSYTTISDIAMPTDDTENKALYWDWICFNDGEINDWHNWMAGIIREYLPDVPLSSKLLNYVGSGLSDGRDLEEYDSWSDWAGCDIVDYYKTNEYYKSVFYYDYLDSVTNKPLYDSETHLTGGMAGDYSTTNKLGKHFYNSLWQGAIHGRNMTSIWFWQRNLNKDSDVGYNSRGVLYHADAVAEIGRVSLDLMRLGKEIETFNNKKADVAIYYSKPTLVHKGRHEILEKVYETLVQNGYKVGVVSDKSVDKLKEYNVLIIPGGDYTTETMLEGVNEFIDNGGKVAYANGIYPMKYNEYGKPLDNSKITKNGTACSTSGMTSLLDFMKAAVNPRITLQVCSGTDENWEDISNDSEGFDWRTVIEGDRALLNISNKDSDKKIRVYLDGKLMTGMRDLISGQTQSDDITISQYSPMLIEIPLDGGVDNITVSNKTISWIARGLNYLGAEIYKVDNSGTFSFDGKENYNTSSHTVGTNGLYMVKPVGTNKNAQKEMIQVSDQNVFTVDILGGRIGAKLLECKVKVTNISDTYGMGLVCVQALKEDGIVYNFICSNVMIPAGQSEEIDYAMPVSEANTFKVFVWDNHTSKKVISNVVSN